MEAIGLILVVWEGSSQLLADYVLLVAFQENVSWGVGCLFVPFVSLIFLMIYWDNAGKPFLVQLAVPFRWFLASSSWAAPPPEFPTWRNLISEAQ